ncbi:MAG: signal peptidase I [Nitratireductor sp.]|nr:signal peptidase I [Nitratireductor sp.]
MAENIRPRRVWLALLLLLTGAHYLYLGRPIRFIAFTLISLTIWIVLFDGLNGLLARPVGGVFILAAGFLVPLVVIVDTIILAVRQKNYEIQSYNRWWVYALTLLLLTLANIAIPGLLRSDFAAGYAVRQFRSAALSMAPQLTIGDRFWADMRAFETDRPARGDIVVFAFGGDENQIWVKRVMGLPGETIQLRDGAVLINGTPLAREKTNCPPDFRQFEDNPLCYLEKSGEGMRQWVTADLKADSVADNTQVFEIPENHYFLLGDNRDNSLDSRFDVGFVPAEDILGRASYIFWSRNRSKVLAPLR